MSDQTDPTTQTLAWRTPLTAPPRSSCPTDDASTLPTDATPPTADDAADADAAEASPTTTPQDRDRGRRRRRPATPTTSDEDVDPVEEFKAGLRRAPGDWFVIHSYAGYENRVKANLETRIQSLNMEDFIFQVEVPMEEVTEIKNGQRKQVRRVRMPGYVLVRMDLTDESWGAVRHTPGVTGLRRPHPPAGAAEHSTRCSRCWPRRWTSRRSRARRPPRRSRSSTSRSASRSPSWRARSRPCRPRSPRSAPTRQKLKVLVSIFGRETPVELSFSQVAKI